MRWKDLRRSSNVRDVRGSGGGMRTGMPLSFGGRRRRDRRGGDPRPRVHLRRPRSRQHAARRRLGAPSGDEGRPLTSNDDASQFVAAVLGSTEDVWGAIFAQSGSHYSAPELTLFDGAVQSACGFASAPSARSIVPDRRVYLDTAFFRDLARLGGPGDFAAAYVIGHEVGHHVQNLLGTSDQVRGAQQRGSEVAANRLQVAMELQADCFAGVWAHHANQPIECSSPVTSTKASAPRRRSATIVCRATRARRARPIRSRTALRPIGSVGSVPACGPATPSRATRSSNQLEREHERQPASRRQRRARSNSRAGRGTRARLRPPSTRSGGSYRSASARTSRSRSTCAAKRTPRRRSAFRSTSRPGRAR